MPELPEVETIARALESVLAGRRIGGATLFRDKLRTPLASLRDARLPGKKVLAVRRRGRYLVVELEGALALLIHLGMTGILKILPREAERSRHEHIMFDIGKGETLRFECARRFSRVELVELPAAGAWPRELDALGVEPLSGEYDAEYFRARAKGRAVPVKVFLMDNAVATGIGNIYATEALFASGISPLRPAGKITRREAEKLVAAVKTVLTRSIEAGGTTFSDYRHLDGSTGHYSVALAIYGKKGEACPRCGARLEAATLGGRTSVYCPKCQK